MHCQNDRHAHLSVEHSCHDNRGAGPTLRLKIRYWSLHNVWCDGHRRPTRARERLFDFDREAEGDTNGNRVALLQRQRKKGGELHFEKYLVDCSVCGGLVTLSIVNRSFMRVVLDGVRHAEVICRQADSDQTDRWRRRSRTPGPWEAWPLRSGSPCRLHRHWLFLVVD